MKQADKEIDKLVKEYEESYNAGGFIAQGQCNNIHH